MCIRDRDRKIYNWFIQNKRIIQTSSSALLQTRCHDSGLEKAIAHLIAKHINQHDMPPIAIMGGHAVRRDADSYWQVVKLARALARRHHLIITGGGPGLIAVSYTHLDVYKRQGIGNAIIFLRHWF